MGAKVRCKKGYNTVEGCVEFKENSSCPVSGATNCEECQAKVFKLEGREERG